MRHTTSGMLCGSSCTSKMLANLSEGHEGGLGSTSLGDVMHEESLEEFFHCGEGQGGSKWLLLNLKQGKIGMRSQTAEQGMADGCETAVTGWREGNSHLKNSHLVLPWQWWSMGTEPLRDCVTSQNHGLVGISRDFSRPSSPTPFFKQGQWQQVSQDHVQMGFEYFQRKRLHNFLWQPVPMFNHDVQPTIHCWRFSELH